MRVSKRFDINDLQKFKESLLVWAQQYREVVWLDSNQHDQAFSSFEAVLAVEAFTAIRTTASGAFEGLSAYQETTKDWIFGCLSYDLKNDVEDLCSENPDGLEFPDLYFFQPKKLFFLYKDRVEVHYLRLVEDEMDTDLKEIRLSKTAVSGTAIQDMLPRIPRGKYLEKINKILEHIRRGDIYEANFCQEFYSENAVIDPLGAFLDLNKISRPPFAAFARLDANYLLSASPERYLRKKGSRLITQPIKGTAPRGRSTGEDRDLLEQLRNDPKERSENIMIVDLVRNDLSRIAAKGSVEVTELCEAYTFAQVHQLISTVQADLAPGLPPVEAIKSTFPMGSMTGAPKISAMQIMEELEESRRGVYSGALGYFTPGGDFDFSVIIRTILYNHARSYLSFSVGGAITAGSKPEKEHEECLVKASALLRVLKSSGNI